MTDKWTKRFIDLAKHIASWSKDTTKVGAVAVDDSRRILETWYNGLPRGWRLNMTFSFVGSQTTSGIKR